MLTPPSVFTAAQHLLALSGPLTALHLQRLLYYACAWHWVWHEEPLFAEEIQAWAGGPLVPRLHREVSVFSAPDDLPALIAARVPPGEDLTAERKESIAAVWDYYSVWSAADLSDLARVEEPWVVARVGLSPMERGERVISPQSLVRYYGQLAGVGDALLGER